MITLLTFQTTEQTNTKSEIKSLVTLCALKQQTITHTYNII